MEENKNPQTESLSEEQLEEIAGGDRNSDNCFFEPEVPVQRKIEHGAVMVKCKSRCKGYVQIVYCKCHSTLNCVDKWHIVEQATPGLADGKWYAKPKGEFNHNEDRKLIKDLYI